MNRGRPRKKATYRRSAKRKRKRLSDQIAAQGVFADPTAESGASKNASEESESGSGSEGSHADECHVCNEMGRLLCCDGCSNACHLHCATPVVTEMPDGNWFCSSCKDVIDQEEDADGAEAPASDEELLSSTKTADNSPFRNAGGFPPSPKVAPLTPEGKKCRKCGLCGVYNAGHNSRTCTAVKPEVGDYFEWGGEDIYIATNPCLKVGQQYFCQFHRYGTERIERRLLSQILTIVRKGPYIGPIEDNYGRDHSGPDLQQGNPAVDQRYCRTNAKPNDAVRNAVHPDIRDASLSTMRKKQQESLERLRVETIGRMLDSNLHPPLGSSCYGIVQMRITLGVDGGDVPLTWLPLLKTHFIDTKMCIRAVATQERGNKKDGLHLHQVRQLFLLVCMLKNIFSSKRVCLHFICRHSVV